MKLEVKYLAKSASTICSVSSNFKYVVLSNDLDLRPLVFPNWDFKFRNLMKPVSGHVCFVRWRASPVPMYLWKPPWKAPCWGSCIIAESRPQAPSFLIQTHDLSHSLQPRLESSKSEVMRWFVQDIDPRSPNPARTSLLTPFIPGCSWGPLLVPSGFHHTLCTVQIVLFSRCLDMKKVARLLLCCFFWIFPYHPPHPPHPPPSHSSFHSVKYWEV